jgi:hypothetical protein
LIEISHATPNPYTASSLRHCSHLHASMLR